MAGYLTVFKNCDKIESEILYKEKVCYFVRRRNLQFSVRERRAVCFQLLFPTVPLALPPTRIVLKGLRSVTLLAFQFFHRFVTGGLQLRQDILHKSNPSNLPVSLVVSLITELLERAPITSIRPCCVPGCSSRSLSHEGYGLRSSIEDDSLNSLHGSL